MPDSTRAGEARVERLDHYRDAALLMRLLGHGAHDHAARSLGRCLSTGDGDGADRWRAIGAAIDWLDRKHTPQWLVR